jgi:hypothetical protein
MIDICRRKLDGNGMVLNSLTRMSVTVRLEKEREEGKKV